MVSRQSLCHIILKQLLTICTTVVPLILTIMKFSLGKKCSRACREPLCPLFRWNKLVILKAWRIICKKSLGDFLLLVNRDCVFPKPPCTQGSEVTATAWDMPVACNREGVSAARALQNRCWCNHTTAALTGAHMALGRRVAFAHGAAFCCTNRPPCLRLMWQSLTVLFCTGIWSCSGAGFHLIFLFLSFWKRDRRSDLWISRGLWQQM